MEIENFDYKSLTKELACCFSSRQIEGFARSTGFIMRSTSQLTGSSFLMLNVFNSSNGKKRSLRDGCDWLEDHFGIEMTKQSLDERYNSSSVDFIKTCFQRVLQVVNCSVIEPAPSLSFPVIQLVDSTSFRIPDNLATFYVGNQGNGGPSVVKMHFNFNLLNGAIADINLTDGVANDNLYKFGKTEKIQAKGLYIRDLGYYDSEYFECLNGNGAYFLSRGRSNTVYYTKDEQGKFVRIDMDQVLPDSGQTKQIDTVYVGTGKTKFKARLILQAVPEKVATQRLDKLEKTAAKHKNKKVSEHAKKMCWFNVYITNAPEQDLPTHLVRLVYTLRWQIELMFKIWKSVFDIDKVKKMSIFRFECYLYSTLIAILLTLHIQNKLKSFLWEDPDFELSELKASQYIKKKL